MIYFPTEDPADLLSSIKLKIDSGRVVGWSYDSDGDFTLSSEAWNQKAWLRPLLRDKSLDFRIVRPKGIEISKGVYAVYHGRIVELVLRYFDTRLIGNASASALPVAPDDVG